MYLGQTQPLNTAINLINLDWYISRFYNYNHPHDYICMTSVVTWFPSSITMMVLMKALTGGDFVTAHNAIKAVA